MAKIRLSKTDKGNSTQHQEHDKQPKNKTRKVIPTKTIEYHKHAQNLK